MTAQRWQLLHIDQYEAPDGEWVRYEDHAAALTSERSQREAAERGAADIAATLRHCTGSLAAQKSYAAGIVAERASLTAALSAARDALADLQRASDSGDCGRSLEDITAKLRAALTEPHP